MTSLSRVVALARVGTVASFLASPRLLPLARARALSTAAASLSHASALELPGRSVSFIKRNGEPTAFAGGSLQDDEGRPDVIESLTDDQIQALLAKLQHTAVGLTPSEVDRVEVFERASKSVAFIQTSIQQSVSPFSSRVNEYPLGAGSGFVWDDQGHVITNYHVIAGGALGRNTRQLPRKVMVKLQGCDVQVEAKVIGFEADKDLAVLKIIDPSQLQQLKPVDIGSSATLQVGQDVLAIGNPFGLDFTLTSGIVSALGREIQGFGGRPIKDCLQTDAAINPGNSGGPLLDSRGRLIGVNTMIYAPNGVGANVGIGFAIPVDTVRRVVNQIILFGQNARPSLGISVMPDADRVRYSRSLGRKLEGAIIANVVKGSPAEALKLSP